MDAILLVGGFGTRLMPLTKTRPKPLIPLANVPFVERTLHWLRDAGIDHVILSLHYNAEQFMEYFASRDLGLTLSFAVEDTPLGTGGAIKNCEPFLRAPRCCIVNGDIFTSLDPRRMLAAHTQARAAVSIALYQVEDPSRFGVIETDAQGQIQTFTEKPPRELARSHDINAGVYIFERAIFDWFPATPCSVERDIFPRLLAHAVPLFGYREWPYWTDLGTPEDYLQAHRDILTRKVRLPLSCRELSPGIWLGNGVTVADDALLRPPVLLGHGTQVAAGATVGPGVMLGDHVCVERDARVEDSVIWAGTTVARDSVVHGCILGGNARVHGQAYGQLCEDGGELICTQTATNPADLLVNR
ncbi:MAG TPA: NDP-sugar synthase [Armatimonadota bacterium]|jgi:NDP-sugar pyrophosphorylase family protein